MCECVLADRQELLCLLDRRSVGDILLICIRVSVDTLYRDGANDVSRERIQTAPLAHPGRAS